MSLSSPRLSHRRPPHTTLCILAFNAISPAAALSLTLRRVDRTFREVYLEALQSQLQQMALMGRTAK